MSWSEQGTKTNTASQCLVLRTQHVVATTVYQAHTLASPSPEGKLCSVQRPPQVQGREWQLWLFGVLSKCQHYPQVLVH